VQPETISSTTERHGLERAGKLNLAIFGTSLLVSLAVSMVVWHAQSLVDNRPDPYWFDAMGKSVARGTWFTPFGTLLHRRSPLYPLFIGLVYRLFGEHEVLIQFAQCLFFAGTCALACDIGRRVFNERTGLIAGLLCAVSPSLLRYVPDFHLETLFTLLLTLSIYRGTLFVERPTLRNAVLLGIALGFATLTKAVVQLYAPLFVVAWWWFEGRRVPRTEQLRSVLTAASLFVGMGLVILPWTVRNYRATGGHLVLVTTGGSDAFLRGLVFSKTEYATLEKPPYTDAENESNAMFTAICKAEGAVWEQDDLQTDRILNKAAKARLLADPVAAVRKFFVGLFTFWYEMTSLKTSVAAGGLSLVLWGFALVGLPRSHREGRRAWIPFLPILYLNLLLAALLALGRYSVPILPCLSVLAAFGIDTLLGRRSSSVAAPSPST
jgi:4-amino-4-deoxy-L-arabinose transferase-like glycosyltransferase